VASCVYMLFVQGGDLSIAEWARTTAVSEPLSVTLRVYRPMCQCRACYRIAHWQRVNQWIWLMTPTPWMMPVRLYKPASICRKSSARSDEAIVL